MSEHYPGPNPEYEININPDIQPFQAEEESDRQQFSSRLGEIVGIDSILVDESAESVHAYEASEDEVALSGLRARRAERRADKARSRAEKWAHKISLYDGLEGVARHHEQGPSDGIDFTDSPKPRNIIERVLDKSIDKKAHKKAVADVYAYRARKVFGDETQLPSGKWQRRLDKASLSIDRHRGEISATEARFRKTDIEAEPLAHGKSMHRISRRRAGRAERGLKRRLYGQGVRQRLLDRAERQAEEHRARAEELKSHSAETE